MINLNIVKRLAFAPGYGIKNQSTGWSYSNKDLLFRIYRIANQKKSPGFRLSSRLLN
jgi:hypothetical protein